MKSLCIFCGSNPGRSSAFLETAREMGELCARRGLRVVYGGGGTGLMGALADAALAAGGEVVGVIPHALVELEVEHSDVTEMLIVRSMHERKQLMHDRSDGFIALPGGLGTFEELLESLTWLQLGHHAKPVGLLNVEGYYDPLVELLERAGDEGLIRPQHRGMWIVEKEPEALLARFDVWKAPPGAILLQREEV